MIAMGIVVGLLTAAAAVALVTMFVNGKFPEFTQREKSRKEDAAERRDETKKKVLGFGTRLAQLLPSRAEDAEVDKDKLAQAGLKMPQETWRGVQILAAAGVGAVGFLIFGLSDSTELPMKALCIAGCVVGGWWLPNLFLYAMRSTRQEEIEKQVPSTLELLCLSVRAGYSLERGIKLVGQEGKGELAQEFRQVDADVNLLGMDLRRALERMSARCGTPLVKSFSNAIIQAQEQGTSVVRILQSQAVMARDAQYTKTMKKVKALANKMTPVVILVFIPLLCAIVLIPSAVQIVGQLGDMM